VSQSTTAEYDAFGPWIDEVRSLDDVPRLYRDRPLDPASARLVLKFPRDISRRDATPTMHLYDHLAVVDDTHLTVLSRTGDAYTEVRVAHADVAAIVDRVNLLDARLTIHTTGGDVVELAYNGSSSDTVRGLVDLLRRLAPDRRAVDPLADVAAIAVPGLDDLGRKDAMFVTSYRELVAREPALRLLAAHGRTRIARRGGLVGRVADLVLPVVLHGAVVAAAAGELQVLSRWEWLVRGGAPALSRGRTIVRLDAVDGVTATEHQRYSGVTLVTLRLGTGGLDIPVPTGSAAERVLRRIPSR
jgi:hypothetical protein